MNEDEPSRSLVILPASSTRRRPALKSQIFGPLMLPWSLFEPSVQSTTGNPCHIKTSASYHSDITNRACQDFTLYSTIPANCITISSISRIHTNKCILNGCCIGNMYWDCIIALPRLEKQPSTFDCIKQFIRIRIINHPNTYFFSLDKWDDNTA